MSSKGDSQISNLRNSNGTHSLLEGQVLGVLFVCFLVCFFFSGVGGESACVEFDMSLTCEWRC